MVVVLALLHLLGAWTVPAFDQLDRAVSRLTVAMVVAALIVGSSIVMTVRGGPMLFGLPAFGLLGFLIAGIGGIWLAWSVLRSGRAARVAHRD